MEASLRGVVCPASNGCRLFLNADKTYNAPMKILLYIVAALTLLGPIAAWTYIVALGCAYKTNSPNCGVRLEDYWDAEFLTLAALPWLIGIICLIAAARKR